MKSRFPDQVSHWTCLLPLLLFGVALTCSSDSLANSDVAEGAFKTVKSS